MRNEHAAYRTIAGVRHMQGKSILTLSDGEEVALPRVLLNMCAYRSGMPFDEAQFCRVLSERAYPLALEKAIALLAGRSRTEKEMVEALRRNAYPETAIARVIAYLHEAGYIDDEQFAERWISTRTAKGLGAHRIRQELLHKGIERQTIDHLLSVTDEDAAWKAAVQAARKASKGKELSDPGDRRKVLAALARRGYDFSMAKRALEQVIHEDD